MNSSAMCTVRNAPHYSPQFAVRMSPQFAVRMSPQSAVRMSPQSAIVWRVYSENDVLIKRRLTPYSQSQVRVILR